MAIDSTKADTLEQAIRKFIEPYRHNKLKESLVRENLADKFELTTADFIGRCSLRELSEDLTHMGFDARYESKEGYSSLTVQLDNPSFGTALGKLDKNTKPANNSTH